MKLVISDEALQWFKDEMEVEKGDKIRFYAQIYGSSPVQETFALGLSKEEPIDIGVGTEAEGILFFIEDADLWYFNGHNLHVGYNRQIDELEYRYVI